MKNNQKRTSKHEEEGLFRTNLDVSEFSQSPFVIASSSLNPNNSYNSGSRTRYFGRQSRKPLSGEIQNSFLNVNPDSMTPVDEKNIQNPLKPKEYFKNVTLNDEIERVKKNSFSDFEDSFPNYKQFALGKKPVNEPASLVLRRSKNNQFQQTERNSFGAQNQRIQYFDTQNQEALMNVTGLKDNDQNQDLIEQHTSRTNKQKTLFCFLCGKDHYFNQCPTQTNSKLDGENSNLTKCFNCRRDGHIAAQCPEPKICLNCHKANHFAKDCPDLLYQKKQKTCFKCGQTGHFRKQCKNQVKCRSCNQFGHELKKCPKNKNKLNRQKVDKRKNCLNCKKAGHYASECPQAERCYNCKGQGHFSRDCPIKPKCKTTGSDSEIESEIEQETRVSVKVHSQSDNEVKNKPKLFSKRNQNPSLNKSALKRGGMSFQSPKQQGSQDEKGRNL